MPQEIKIDGIGISPDVLTAIVSRAVSDVEGIAYRWRTRTLPPTLSP